MRSFKRALQTFTGALMIFGMMDVCTLGEILPQGTQTMCLSNINLRGTPSITAPKTGSLYRGQVLRAVETRKCEPTETISGNWCLVRLPEGKTGWACMDYLSLGRLGSMDSPALSIPTPTQISHQPLPLDFTYHKANLSGKNKVNGIIYRMRFHRLLGSEEWVGPDIPEFVPRSLNPDFVLVILDIKDNVLLAFYRSRPCTGDFDQYRARAYTADGTLLWSLSLDRFLPSDKKREVQDIRYTGSLLIFNAACTSYCDEVECRCSALVAIDPVAGEEVWRTPALVSNNIFIVEDDWIFCGYGFTAEPDFLYIVEKTSGRVVYSQHLDSAMSYLELHQNTLSVITYKSLYRFRISN